MSAWSGCECLIEACTKKVYSRWLCARHYNYAYKNLWQQDRRPVNRSVSSAERFAEKLLVTPSCWLWVGATIHSGYGAFYSIDYPETSLAHRVSYRMFIGDIPEGFEIDHTFVEYGCPRNCVNPSHLRLATRIQNCHNKRITGLSASGVRGVAVTGNTYGAYLSYNYTRHWLGTYKTIEEASAAVEAKRKEMLPCNA